MILAESLTREHFKHTTITNLYKVGLVYIHSVTTDINLTFTVNKVKSYTRCHVTKYLHIWPCENDLGLHLPKLQKICIKFIS